MATSLHEHGTRQRYQTGCRCGDCTRSNTEYQRLYRARTMPTFRTVTTTGGYRYEQLTLD